MSWPLPFILAHIQVQPFQWGEAADGGSLVVRVDVWAVLAAPAAVPLATSDHGRASNWTSDGVPIRLPGLGPRNWDAPSGACCPRPPRACCPCPSFSPFWAALGGADSSHPARDAQGGVGLAHGWEWWRTGRTIRKKNISVVHFLPHFWGRSLTAFCKKYALLRCTMIGAHTLCQCLLKPSPLNKN